MSRLQIFEAVYQGLLANTTVMGLLGSPTAGNFRVYRSYPQFQSLLTSVPFEPTGNDAWLVLEEPNPQQVAERLIYETAWEVLELTFHVFTVRLSLAEEVIDALDVTWHWQVDQQRDLQYGTNLVLHTRRFNTEETYNPEIKLYDKRAQYRMIFVQETLSA